MTAPPPAIEPKRLASMIDHTILRPEAVPAEILAFCVEARQHGFRSVCVNPGWVREVSSALSGSPVATCSVVGFPFGAARASVKAEEARQAVAEGADEIDMVLAIGRLRDGQTDLVGRDIARVRVCCPDAVLKVIIETCLLTDDEKREACRIAVAEGADFVKTSTGFAKAGATVEDVALMRAAVGPTVGVKASGGVRTLEAAVRMIGAGATRIGTSSGLALVGAGDRGPGY